MIILIKVMTIICNAVLQKTTKHTAESRFTSQITDEEITSTVFEMKSFHLPAAGPVAKQQPRHCNLIRIYYNTSLVAIII